MLPDSMVPDALAQGRLRQVLPDYCLGRSSFHLVYPSTRFLSPKVRVFVDFCVEWFEAEFRPSDTGGLGARRARPAAAKARRA